jgi:beta-glucanase (GH16 family)
MRNRAWKHYFRLAGILIGTLSAAAIAADSVWVQIWSDECNGAANAAIDASKWSMVNGGGGFGNGELQYYTDRAANSYYDGAGNLVIKTMKESYSGSGYTSAKIFSRNKGDWTYCRMDIRAKIPKGRCMWPAFWMMPTSSKYGGWPACGEIDIMELRGDQPGKITSTLHFGNPHGQVGYGYNLPNSQSFDAAYHIIRMDWSAGLFKFYVDSAPVGTMTSSQWFTSGVSHTTNPNAPFDQNFYIQLNTAVGGPNSGYTGNVNPDDAIFPIYMYIDYVRVFKKMPAGSAVVDKERRGSSAVKVIVAAPGRSGSGCCLTFDKKPAAGTLSIFTLRGERLRTIDLGANVNNRIAWDGKNAAGRSVGKGTYLVSAEGSGFHSSGRIVIN